LISFVRPDEAKALRRPGRGEAVGEEGERAGFREVFGVAEFRALWSAQLLSVAGDQLAKVALTVLVYARTGSAVLAALTFAVSFVPNFIGGILLSGLADRLPRRGVMIACDLIRMGLAALMAVPVVPLPVLVALLFLITMIGAPFTAARAAVYPVILSGGRYTTGTAVTLTTNQLAQVIGFAAGGAMTGLLGARPCLLADSATFAVSALLVRFGVAARASDGSAGRGVRAAVAGLGAGTRLVFATPALRMPMLFGWLAAFYNAPEGIAAPFARSLGGGAATTGLLLAFPAAGYTVGALAFSRLLGPESRMRLMAPLAVATSAALVPIALRPDLAVTLVILAASGTCACFQVAANAAFVVAAPPAQRSQAFGLAAAGMSLGQGVAMALAGVGAQHHAPAMVISAAGVLGVIAAAGLMLPLPFSKTARPRAWPGG
jgi:predicted MFS family arabinose efflux permease